MIRMRIGGQNAGREHEGQAGAVPDSRQQRAPAMSDAARQRMAAAIGQLDDLDRLIAGSSSGRLLDRTGTLAFVPGISLVEPSGLRATTVVDRGGLEITAIAIRFTGAARRLEWPVKNVREVTAGPGRLSLTVTGRSAGVRFTLAPELVPVVELALQTARRLQGRALVYAEFRLALTQLRSDLAHHTRESDLSDLSTARSGRET